MSITTEDVQALRRLANDLDSENCSDDAALLRRVAEHLEAELKSDAEGMTAAEAAELGVRRMVLD